LKELYGWVVPAVVQIARETLEFPEVKMTCSDVQMRYPEHLFTFEQHLKAQRSRETKRTRLAKANSW